MNNQVKVRGYRIELGELEEALNQHPNVNEAAVLFKTNLGNEKQLIAYLEFKNNLRETREDLRDYLKKLLPEYMVPGIFLEVTPMPLTPNGKVDRKGLEAYEGKQIERKEEFISPVSDTEVSMAKIWSNVLGVNQIGLKDNFFELGGDSILTIQVVSQARQVGIKMSPRQIFEHQTIEQLARFIEIEEELLVTAEQGLVIGEFPLTPIQCWFFNKGEYQAEVELNLPVWLQRARRAWNAFWTQTLGQLPADPFHIPFVDYARGDGLRIGPGNWSLELISEATPWVSRYRGLWGLYARDPISGENAPAGPMYNRDGSPRGAWYDPLGFAGLDKVPPPLQDLEVTESECVALTARQRELEKLIPEKSDRLQACWARLKAMEDNPHLAKQYDAR